MPNWRLSKSEYITDPLLVANVLFYFIHFLTVIKSGICIAKIIVSDITYHWNLMSVNIFLYNKRRITDETKIRDKVN